MKTEAMKEREELLNSEWKDEGDGYFSLIGNNGLNIPDISGEIAYVALPNGHPDIGKDYDDLEPEVNGGLTFAEGNVFGWDYAHLYNRGTPTEHIKNALDYFKKREK